MANLISWIIKAIVFGTVIMLGASGEILTEKAGHLNLGVPGIMYTTGFVSYYLCYLYETNTSSPSAFVVVLIALFSAIVIGGLFGLLYSVMCVTLKCNQNVMGLLIASFGVGFGKFLSLAANITDGKATFTGTVFTTGIPGLSQIPYIGKILFGYGFMTYLAIIVAVLLHLFLKKTRTGLNLKAVGEDPSTADAVGINTTRYRYIATIVGCALSGIAGMTFVLQYTTGLWSSNNDIEALGWLAVALVIFVSWKPVHLIWGSYIFGLLYWAFNYFPAIFGIKAFRGMDNLFNLLPYLVTIVILVINSLKKKHENQPPLSLGKSYFREDR